MTSALLTYQDVAQVAKVDPRTVQRWCKRLNLPVVRVTACTVRLPAETVRVLIGTPVAYGKSLENLSERPTLKTSR